MGNEYKIDSAIPERDAIAIAAIYEGYVRNTAITFEEAAPGPEAIAERIRDSNRRHRFLVARSIGPEEQLLGYAYAGPHRARAAYRWCVDFAIYLDPYIRGRGIGKALYRALIAITRQQGYLVAYAGVTEPNIASTALHRSLGFQFLVTYEAVGYKHGRWHDVSWYRLKLGEQTDSPKEPCENDSATA